MSGNTYGCLESIRRGHQLIEGLDREGSVPKKESTIEIEKLSQRG